MISPAKSHCLIKALTGSDFISHPGVCHAKSASLQFAEATNSAGVSPRIDELEGRVLLATFRVNTTADSVAANLKTGRDAAGEISLRSAIQAANAKPNADTIIVPAGTYILTINGANDDNDATGDLDIKGNLTIKGSGAAGTIVDANSIDRAFQVLSGKVQISGLTIQHGVAEQGGGLLNSGGKVTLSSDIFSNNVAAGASARMGSMRLGEVQNGGTAATATTAAMRWGEPSPIWPAR